MSRRLRIGSLIIAVVVACWTTASVHGQTGALKGEWRTYGGDLGHTRYAPLDQINAGNFSKLEVAWRFKTDNLGPRLEFNLQSTPLVVGNRVFSTGGTRRAVVSLDAATGELLWVHSEDEGARGAAGTASALGTRAFVLDRRQRGTHPLRDARLPAGCARREDRQSRALICQQRHPRSQGRSRSQHRSHHRFSRTPCDAHRRRRHRPGRRRVRDRCAIRRARATSKAPFARSM